MLPIAHAGHWALWILYAVPVIVVCASIVTSVLRERRGSAEGAPARPNGSEEPR
jgi:hypothetical protein